MTLTQCWLIRVTQSHPADIATRIVITETLYGLIGFDNKLARH